MKTGAIGCVLGMLAALPMTARSEENNADLRVLPDTLELMAHPRSPIFLAACTPRKGSQLDGYSGLSFVFTGREGFIIGFVRADGRDIIIAAGDDQGAQEFPFRWTYSMGGVWISYQLEPIERQFEKSGYSYHEHLTLEDIRQAAKRVVCHEAPPWPPKPVIDALPR